MYDTNEQKILEVIFNNPTTKFHLLELARITKLHPNTVITVLDKLEKNGLIEQEKKKHLKEIFGNKDSPEFNIEKRISNLKRLYKSKLIGLLKEKFNPESISVIGSYSRGEDIEDSDIDIVIISKKEYSKIDLKSQEESLGRKIHLIITDYKHMSDEFYINFINGIVLYGAVNKK